jgi:hypothetical protein
LSPPRPVSSSPWPSRPILSPPHNHNNSRSWWYNGPFYFGNVKSVVDWHASNASRLFPNGLPLFSDKLGLPLQLYAPFWADAFETPYNMTESSTFKGTKLVVPADSYAFFSDFFDLGSSQTNGRMAAFEIDFLDSNFQGSPSMFESVDAADLWYGGMADAALERGMVLQYCLPSVTDMLQSLTLPAVVQARASDDYVQTQENPVELGGSSLIMGATRIAPSKDTLWTFSPQPATYSDTHEGGDYTTQPHVRLDAVLATMSLGPVGISDALNYTDVGLISQSFLSSADGTLLRPSRPLSWVDSFIANKSVGAGAAAQQDVRSTHAAVPLARGGAADAPVTNSHYVVACRRRPTSSSAPPTSTRSPAPPPPSSSRRARTSSSPARGSLPAA